MTTTNTPRYTLNNGVEMPIFGLGVFNSQPDETVSAVKSAIENGYRLIDTASLYMNETQVGEGVRSSGISRQDIFVTTKLRMRDYGHKQTLAAVHGSLLELGMDYIDLYLLHWPVPSAFEETVNSYKAAMTLLAEGKIRALGVCNFTAEDLDILIEQTGHVPAVNQVELHPFFNQLGLRQAASKHGIITQAWSPIGGVKRYGKKAKAAKLVEDPLSHPTVTKLAEKYAKTPAQIILRWQIELGTSPIPKSVRPERIAENIDIFDFALSGDEVDAINALDTGERGGPAPEEVSPQTFPAYA